MSVFVFIKVFSEKLEKGVGRSTRRVLLWHGYGSEYWQGTAAGMEMVMCDYPGFIKEGGHV
jgi:hypothetical protein